MRPLNLVRTLRRCFPTSLPSAQLALRPPAEPPPLLSGRVGLTVLGDGSPSLSEFMSMVRHGFRQIPDQVRRDGWLSERTDVSIYCLGNDTPAQRLAEWQPAATFSPPEMLRCDHTPLYGGIALVLDEAGKRSHALRHVHTCDEALNIVFVVSDFMPTDTIEAEAQMNASLRRAAEEGVQLVLLAVGDVDVKTAESIAQPGRPPLLLKDVDDFTLFFKQIGRTIQQRSMTMGGAPLQLDYQGQSLRID